MTPTQIGSASFLYKPTLVTSSNAPVPASGIPRPPLKAFLNAKCGNADKAREALEEVGYDLEEVEPGDMEARLKTAIDGGIERILVAGGDGTIATAASLVAKSETQLAILPGGTLNHFAKDHNIPTDFPAIASD